VSQGGITKVTLAIGHRCPTCGELPPDFRGSFERRVEQNWLDPAQSKPYEGPKPEGWDEAVRKFPELQRRDESPAGLYPSVIVPMYLIGRVIRITPVEE